MGMKLFADGVMVLCMGMELFADGVMVLADVSALLAKDDVPETVMRLLVKCAAASAAYDAARDMAFLPPERMAPATQVNGRNRGVNGHKR
eukprot:458784-Pyramimonas_sp.AAC.1